MYSTDLGKRFLGHRVSEWGRQEPHNCGVVRPLFSEHRQTCLVSALQASFCDVFIDTSVWHIHSGEYLSNTIKYDLIIKIVVVSSSNRKQ